MVKIISKLLILGAVIISFVAAAEVFEMNESVGIPYELISEEHESNITIGDGEITIIAKKGTDLYTNADASNTTDNAPRLFFEPKSDFILSAKVTASFTTAYDGGAIFVYGGKERWGKLLFERFKSGDNGIASTVTEKTGDDAYHNIVMNNEIYLKIERKNDTFTFSYSEDAEHWLYRRSFNLIPPKQIKVGFIAQSPISEVHKVVYSNIRFEE